eukprot:jgi/Ulvmu1/3342/UM155_0025.1
MLGLRAAGYTGQAQANGHGMEWERLGTSAEAMLRWAPMTARLLLARERHMHAVPLESVSLELMHGEGQWQNERPAEEKVEYTAAVGSVLAALGRLTALTRLDLCVAPATVRLDHMAVTLAQTVSSLGRLRLSMSWDAACTAAVLPSLRVLSQLTELTLNLRDARSGCLSGEAMREVVAGVGAAMLAGPNDQQVSLRVEVPAAVKASLASTSGWGRGWRHCSCCGWGRLESRLRARWRSWTRVVSRLPQVAQAPTWGTRCVCRSTTQTGWS